MFDAEGRISLVNRRYIEMYRLSELVVRPGCSFRQLMAHRKETGLFTGDVEAYCLELEAIIAAGETSRWIVDTADGRSMSIVNRPLPGGGWVVTHEDITDLVTTERRLEHLALHDPLTDLPNRTLFRLRLEAALEKLPPGESLAIVILDLDNFKAVNDTYGHPAGDELLQVLAGRLRSCVRESDTLARLGGDEFAIVQTASNGPEACRLAERITSIVAEPIMLHGRQLATSFSFGVAVAPDNGRDPDQLLKNADLALYAAKAAGRGRYQLFTPQMDAAAAHRHFLEHELNTAVRNRQFEVYYQPVVSMKTGVIAGYEALVRWRHPKRGVIAPGEFIALAEDLGLIEDIGAQVLEMACATAACWPQQMSLAVNLSPVQLRNPAFADQVAAALQTSRLPAARLELELTEQTLVTDVPALRVNLEKLRQLGVRLVMDDFGVGYCSLNYLRQFPFDKLKIDQSFIATIPGDARSLALVRAIVGMAHAFGMTTVAEGVETPLQRDAVRALGCTFGQGFLFGRPLPNIETEGRKAKSDRHSVA